MPTLFTSTATQETPSSYASSGAECGGPLRCSRRLAPGRTGSCVDLSVVIATHNRRPVVERTLRSVKNLDLEEFHGEIIVVDNHSHDGTREVGASLADRFVSLRRNQGSCAKAFGVAHARGRYILFLDDDAVPQAGAVPRMIRRMDGDDRLACAGFSVHLPDGSKESSALPGVFVGCGAGLRADALRTIGGLDRFFFMQAEEFDLCFRLVERGWRIGVYPDLIVDHLKTSHGRRSRRTLHLDTRNNLLVAERYLPKRARTIYRQDWLTRYRWMALRDGMTQAVERGRRAGAAANRRCRIPISSRLSAQTFEAFFRWQEVAARMQRLTALGFRRVLLADLGKNIYPFVRGARLAGMELVAVADDRFAFPGRAYRGVPVVASGEAARQRFDVVVVSNTAAALASASAERWRGLTDRPVLDWFSRPAVIDPHGAQVGMA